MTVSFENPRDGSRLFGMENFGNTCYCNSILQCLFYTTKFRTHLLNYNTQPHERRTEVVGMNPHAYTTKYEQLLAKKIKEQAKGPAQESPAVDTPASGSLQSRPSIRHSIFGKFSAQSTPMLTKEDVAAPLARKVGYAQDAVLCELLSVEQRLLIKKTPALHHLQLFVTRPTYHNSSHAPSQNPSDASVSDNTDSSTPSTALLEGSVANTAVTSVETAVSSRSSIVVVGIPQPESALLVPINTFSSNPSSDQRKRAALINGPILNVDHSFLPDPSDLGEACLLYALKDLFEAMTENSSQIGVMSPLYFITKLKEKNFLFRQANMHHDAHEFCNYLVNETIETINSEVGINKNWCTNLFQGIITNETKCLSCESVTSKDESFLDLSIDIPPGEGAHSLTFSLNNFSKLETLIHQNKFYCNTCLSLQEAIKTIKLKKTPEVLIINLKRFKYDDKLDRMVKLFDSILYPLKLRLFNTTSESSTEDGADAGHDPNEAPKENDGFSLFGLYALVVHIGGGPMHGHYVALCKCQAGLWFLFDDETVELVDESYVLRFFGDGPGLSSAYILFYEKLTTKVQDDGLDFGIDFSRVYNGSDYSLATLNGGKTPAFYSEYPSNVTTPEFDSVQEFFPESKPTEAPLEKPLSRTTSLFKKTLMFDSKESEKSKDQTTASPDFTKMEKKSWVDGLKRRELRADFGPTERQPSVSRVQTNGSVKSVGGEEADSEKQEKPKRKSSIFSFKKKK